jgi:large subunit ribosomal protein L37Ae
MVKTELRTAKRFGARYGRKVKHKLAAIEKEQKKYYKCPYCNNIKVKRVSAGIWKCRKCSSKFTNKAYVISKVLIKSEEAISEKD